MLVEFMMTAHRRVDIEMFQKHTRSTRVFRQYEIRLFEDADRAESHVVEIAHRSRHYVQPAAHSLKYFFRISRKSITSGFF